MGCDRRRHPVTGDAPPGTGDRRARPAAAPPDLPLAGIRVLDLSRFIAGPLCAQILGDFGAEVIKVERPGGEDARFQGPTVRGEAVYTLVYNRNKLGITLDTRHLAAAPVLRRLVAISDVLVENYRPGTLETMGLGAEARSALNPRLIVTSLSGFGQTGPLAGRALFESDRPGDVRADEPDRRPRRAADPRRDVHRGSRRGAVRVGTGDPGGQGPRFDPESGKSSRRRVPGRAVLAPRDPGRERGACWAHPRRATGRARSLRGAGGRVPAPRMVPCLHPCWNWTPLFPRPRAVHRPRPTWRPTNGSADVRGRRAERPPRVSRTPVAAWTARPDGRRTSSARSREPAPPSRSRRHDRGRRPVGGAPGRAGHARRCRPPDPRTPDPPRRSGQARPGHPPPSAGRRP